MSQVLGLRVSCLGLWGIGSYPGVLKGRYYEGTRMGTGNPNNSVRR